MVLKIKNKIQTLKGFRDFLPQEALARQYLEKKIRRVFESWGYDPIETPTLEPLELFEGQIGEDEKLFYKFQDQGKRQVALRYEQTVPACRVVSQYSQRLAMPFKRYQIQPAFRAEKPQRGRYREFLQCDADIFGIESPLADAEAIALSLDIYRQLGFPKAKVLISDRSLLKDLPYKAITAIDKLKKIGEEGVLREMKDKGIELETAKQYLFKVKSLKPNQAIETILGYLDKSGFAKDWREFEPALARSFAYSTGPIWEIEIPGFKGGSVLGGERYDKLVEIIAGVKIPGTGFGLGFDRTLEAAQTFNLIPQLKTTTQVLVTVFSPSLLNKSLEAARALREAEINTDIYSDPEVKLDKQLKYADKKGIPYVLILGEEEVRKNMVALKDLKSGKQKTIKITRAIEKLRS